MKTTFSLVVMTQPSRNWDGSCFYDYDITNFVNQLYDQVEVSQPINNVINLKDLILNLDGDARAGDFSPSSTLADFLDLAASMIVMSWTDADLPNKNIHLSQYEYVEDYIHMVLSEILHEHGQSIFSYIFGRVPKHLEDYDSDEYMALREFLEEIVLGACHKIGELTPDLTRYNFVKEYNTIKHVEAAWYDNCFHINMYENYANEDDAVHVQRGISQLYRQRDYRL